jgi:hypothetical protein
VVVKVEGMGQEEAAVVAEAVRGGAGNDLPQFSFSMIFHLKGTLSRCSFRIIGLSHGFLSSGSRFLRTKLKKEES